MVTVVTEGDILDSAAEDILGTPAIIDGEDTIDLLSGKTKIQVWSQKTCW